MIEKESQMRLIGYGGMLTESFVAIMALITASILDQHLYFAINAPVAAHRRHRGDGCRDYVNQLGLSGPPVTGATLTDAAASVGEKSIVSRDRRRADAGGRHVRRAATVFWAARASRRSGTTSRSCSRRCSS